MKVPVYSISGKVGKSKTALPAAFDSPVRKDLVRRAVRAAQANRRQPYGPSRHAGMQHSAKWPGKGRGMARTPRIQGNGRGAEAPNTVGGRRAHPPKTSKQWPQKINARERRVAFCSALAATADATLVAGRGHQLSEKATTPFVVSKDIESLAAKHEGESLTRRAQKLFVSLGLDAELERGATRKVRAGKGKRRGRRYRRPKSALVVLSEFNGTERAFRNLGGVDVTTAAQLNTEMLAPGGDLGRLMVISQPALKALEARL
ncbi:MAG: 50S ribosomal protein L4 [Candidatus Thermoplasmatota archaeon]|nr:50S ribosomal protein L4 [Candidatus Thermoplasmatota archaeon]